MKKRLCNVVLCRAKWNGESTSDPDLFSKCFHPDLSKKGTIIKSSSCSPVSNYLTFVIGRFSRCRKDYKSFVLHSSDDLVIESQCIGFYKDEYYRDCNDTDMGIFYCLVKFYDVCK